MKSALKKIFGPSVRRSVTSVQDTGGCQRFHRKRIRDSGNGRHPAGEISAEPVALSWHPVTLRQSRPKPEHVPKSLIRLR